MINRRAAKARKQEGEKENNNSKLETMYDMQYLIWGKRLQHRYVQNDDGRLYQVILNSACFCFPSMLYHNAIKS